MMSRMQMIYHDDEMLVSIPLLNVRTPSSFKPESGEPKWGGYERFRLHMSQRRT